jgi:hypothetical protein
MNIKIKSAIAVGAIVLIAASVYQFTVWKIKGAVLEVLLDPYSAKIENITFKEVINNAIIHTCVDVNAKNRMGGYVGKDTFTVLFDPLSNNAYAIQNPSCRIQGRFKGEVKPS